jgi:hypothetical protein
MGPLLIEIDHLKLITKFMERDGTTAEKMKVMEAEARLLDSSIAPRRARKNEAKETTIRR